MRHGIRLDTFALCQHIFEPFQSSDPPTKYVSYGEENILRKLVKPCEMNMGQDKLFMSGIDRI